MMVAYFVRAALVLTMLGTAFWGGSACHAEELTGMVMTEAGTPAAGATISCASIFQVPPWREVIKADDSGFFRIDLPRTRDHVRYALAVRWKSQGAEVLDGLDRKGKSVGLQGQKLPSQTIRLKTEGRLYGKLLRAEDGGPIPQAKLYLDTGEVLQTGDDGGFEVNGLPLQEHSLIPVADGRVRQYVLFDTTRRPDCELELRLPRGAVIKGIVSDEKGNPIPSAYVTRRSSGTALTLNGWDEPCKADGSFEYGGLSTERLFYGLEVEAPGYESQSIVLNVNTPDDTIERKITLRATLASMMTKPFPAAPNSKPGEEESVELPRKVIEGHVRKQNGEAIPGAAVRWAAFLWDQSVQPTESDDAGHFRLENVPEGAGAILVIAKGFAPRFIPVAKSENRADVELERGESVRGIVAGSAGTPIAGVRIIPVTHCPDAGFCNPIWLSELAVETNDRGEFRIPAMPAHGMSFDLLKSGFSDMRNVALDPGEKEHTVRLSAGGAVGGKVVDTDGNPVRQFKARVMIPRKFTPPEPVGGYYAGFGWYGINFTRDDGSFVLTGMPAHNWLRLIISSPGVGLAIFDRVQSESLDQLTSPEQFRIRLSPFVPLTVRVETEAGKPVADATVGLLEDVIKDQYFNWGHDDLWMHRVRSDAAGKVTFGEPACEDGTVLISAAGFARRKVVWRDGAKDLSATLQPEARLEGEVTLKGRRVKEGYVRLSNSENESFSTKLADHDGRFAFDRMPAGDYSIDISDNNGRSLHSGTITLTAGATTTENIALPAQKR